MNKRLFCSLLCLPSLSWTAEEPRIDIARFSQGDLSGWQTKVFAGETQYALEKSQGRLGLRADSNAAASGRYREISINLEKTSILNWTWKIDNVLTGIDERTRGGGRLCGTCLCCFFWRACILAYPCHQLRMVKQSASWQQLAAVGPAPMLTIYT